MKGEETVDHNVKMLWHGIYRMYNQQAVKHDITTSIGFVLLIINSKEGTPATKIAPLMGLESRSLTRMLKSMEEKGFIYREKDPTDGRSVRIFLTDLGKQKREISRATVLRFNEFTKQSIEKEKLDIFFEVVDQINSLIDKKSIF
ncbi:MAG: MarR family transcriptional regulator [Cytophagales bacterium CG12_big_fil_rev_8_21_14_0_65_40_12]|nr:MAG: MarR family transcriptional regulator [Cytophagales bacterium CG12_big_fil_rev_8_21_14_0_65_40_12]PIW05871.1 MAG: MarR family transcriptional regulator [Cytophagales bacterium CG17_big_fil_post_rev_8_21_14_2_50_40_13]